MNSPFGFKARHYLPGIHAQLDNLEGNPPLHWLPLLGHIYCTKPALTDFLEQVDLCFEEVDMTFLVRQQLLEKFHGNVVAGVMTDIARLLVGRAGVVLAGKIGF